ncbi:MAG: class I SAM-dependent DNA methyltransferase [Acidobacteria bacterium]|nr:class I SAM-dependent DNA methyltransferase [Acidobacteriota bacterium]
MALKKSQLYSSLWQSCDELRGGMDASQYKDYVLTLLFVKYVSDRRAGDPMAVLEVPEGGGFADIVRLKGTKHIGDGINRVISRLAEANELKGVIDQADFNDEAKLGAGKEMQDRLTKLVAIFEGLDFGGNRAGGDDLLGDAYEYLMVHFATQSGKSKGQFYTPSEVSRILARVVGTDAATNADQTVYDPTCGSGSLLLKAADEAPVKITVYGQEKDNATWALARMNLILHGHPTAELWQGNTLADPHFKGVDRGLRRFDFAVANPPFSDKAWTNGLDPENDEFGRFEYGVPPVRNGDYAFLLHLIRSLKSAGRGAMILPHGVLFRGNREADIRRNLLRGGLIEGVIGLPPNLFYGTGIPACIVVVDKKGAPDRKGVFIVDASGGYRKDGAKNRLREQDIHRIVDVFRTKAEIPGYARLVPLAEIASEENGYNLNIPRYVPPAESEDLHDLEAHLKGGIPDYDLDALRVWWKALPGLREALFAPFARAGYSRLQVEPHKVGDMIHEHVAFRSLVRHANEVFEVWRGEHEETLLGLGQGSKPESVLTDLSESLLLGFTGFPLMDPYDLYQRLRDYCDETMRDDLFLVAADGWVEAAQPRAPIRDKKGKLKETPELSVGRTKYKMDLLPPRLVISRYLAGEKAELDRLREAREAVSRLLEEFVEEHSAVADGEDGPLAAAVDEKGKVTQVAVRALLKALPNDPELAEDRRIVQQCVVRIKASTAAERAEKAAATTLSKAALDRYPSLTEAEIKELVVVEKWFAELRCEVQEEIERVAGLLADRVRMLEERYRRPLPKIEHDVDVLSAKVAGHLERMGLT